MFDRIESLIGTEKMNLIKSKTVLLVGVGGVGASCFETLIRSGVGRIIVIDYDKVDITNLNRQVITFNDNIGLSKTDVSFLFAKKINPSCEVKTYNTFLDESNIGDILNDNKIDYVIDACDSVKTKKVLILECNKRNIKIISCMGTGNKIDPTKLEITNIYKTNNDPLAKNIRKWARDNKLKKLVVVSSTEIPIKKSSTISSISFVPNTAGILLANYVIRDIIDM